MTNEEKKDKNVISPVDTLRVKGKGEENYVKV